MRIRRNACRLLGSAVASSYICPSPPKSQLSEALPKPATALCVTGYSATPIDCELNQSPWDLSTDLDLFFIQVDGICDDENGSVGSSGIKTERAPSYRMGKVIVKKKAVQEETIDKQKVESMKAGKMMRPEMERNLPNVKKKEAAVEPVPKAALRCKKNDEKKWHSKLPVNHPSSLCDYHLTRARSYSTANYDNVSMASSTAATNYKPARKKAADNPDWSDPYYYYDSFGPWREKRRGPSSQLQVPDRNGDKVGSKVGDSKTNDEDQSGARDDEYKKTAIVGRKDETDYNGEGGDDKKVVEKRSYRKRGRTRSLKSLL